MTDDQLEKLIDGLRPEEKTRWQNLVDNSLGLVLGALAVGFFALLWQSRNDVDTRAARLETRAASIEQSILGLQETLKKEIGDLAGPVAVQASIKEAVLSQNKLLQELDYRLNSLERRNTNTAAAGTAPITRADEPPVQPFPNVKSEEVIKAIREKEDSIDKRFRQYEQRTTAK